MLASITGSDPVHVKVLVKQPPAMPIVSVSMACKLTVLMTFQANIKTHTFDPGSAGFAGSTVMRFAAHMVQGGAVYFVIFHSFDFCILQFLLRTR